MIKYTVEYTDYDGKKVKKDLYFHLSKADLIDMQLSVDGGMDTRLKALTKSKKVKDYVEFYKELICRAYGLRSSDGESFTKNKEIQDAFRNSEAFSEFFVMFVSKEGMVEEFVNGVMPK